LLVKDVFCEFGNAFRVRLGFKDVSFVLEHCFQFAVIGDDAVVHDNKFSFGITPEWGLEITASDSGIEPVRMTIERRRLTVGCPSSVRNASMGHECFAHVDVLFINQLS